MFVVAWFTVSASAQAWYPATFVLPDEKQSFLREVGLQSTQAVQLVYLLAT